MQELEKKIKDLKEFIKEKTDQGTANYLGKEIREICGMVESEQFFLHGVSQRRELLKGFMQYVNCTDTTNHIYGHLLEDYLKTL